MHNDEEKGEVARCGIAPQCSTGSGEHIATIGFNDFYCVWQIVVVRHEEIEFFYPSKDVAFAAWHDKFDPESGFPRSTMTRQHGG